MNRINPLYILLLFVTFAIVSFSIVANVKKEFANNANKMTEFNKSALEYDSLKNVWFNKKRIQKTLNNLRNEVNIKNAKLEININKNIALIKLTTKEKKVINKFVNKILNKKLMINKMDITNTQVVVEVSLK